MTRPENSFPARGQVPGEMSVTDENLARVSGCGAAQSQRGTEPAMNVKADAPCALCGHNDGRVKVYRDPFGTAIAPGRWPNLTMHSDCFLTYIRTVKGGGFAVDHPMVGPVSHE